MFGDKFREPQAIRTDLSSICLPVTDLSQVIVDHSHQMNFSLPISVMTVVRYLQDKQEAENHVEEDETIYDEEGSDFVESPKFRCHWKDDSWVEFPQGLVYYYQWSSCDPEQVCHQFFNKMVLRRREPETMITQPVLHKPFGIGNLARIIIKCSMQHKLRSN